MERTPSSILKSPNNEPKHVSVRLALIAAPSARMKQNSTQDKGWKPEDLSSLLLSFILLCSPLGVTALDMILTRVLGLPPNQQKLTIGQTRTSGKALLGLLLQLQKGWKTNNRPSCLLPKVGDKLAPYMGWGLGCAQGSGQKDGLGVLPTLLGCWVQGACSVLCFCSQHLAFALGSSEVVVGVFWSFCIFQYRICQTAACRQLFLVQYSFFVFCCSRRHLPRYKHCSTVAEGPRSVSDRP